MRNDGQELEDFPAELRQTLWVLKAAF